MAEIVTLVIFVLLLALSAILTTKVKQEDELSRQLADERRTVAELRDRLEAYQAISSGVISFDEIWNELVISREESNTLREQVASLMEKNEGLASVAEQLSQQNASLQEVLAQSEEVMRELTASGEEPLQALKQLKAAEVAQRQIAAVFASRGLDPDDPEALSRALEGIAPLKDLEQLIADAGFDVRNPETLSDQLAEAQAASDALSKLGDENATLRERTEYFKRIAGGQLPSCWIHPETKRSEYIFDVVLASGGLVIYDRDIPHRRDEKAELPTRKIIFEQELPPVTFLEQTKELYRWSEAHECRFFVRVFDRTATTEKELFVDRLLTAEGRFYKWLVNDDTVPGT